jgi:hypothetical protein
MNFDYVQYGRNSGKTFMSEDWLYNEPQNFNCRCVTPLAQPHKMHIATDAQINTSVYEEAEVVE